MQSQKWSTVTEKVVSLFMCLVLLVYLCCGIAGIYYSLNGLNFATDEMFALLLFLFPLSVILSLTSGAMFFYFLRQLGFSFLKACCCKIHCDMGSQENTAAVLQRQPTGHNENE